MALRTPAAAIEQANLLLAANAATENGARHKFPGWLLHDIEAPANELQALLGSVSGAESERRAAQTTFESAIADGDDLVRDVNSYLKSLPRAVNRDAIKAHYGIARGVGGGFTHDQIINLLRGFVAAHGTAPDAAKLRPDLLNAIEVTLAQIDAHRPGAAPGERQETVAARDAAWERLESALSRAWHYLSAALPGGVFDPGLARYGFTPRQPPNPPRDAPAPQPNPPAANPTAATNL